MRKTIFSTNEYYHIYNRGTDKRNIFLDKEDLSRFLQYLKDLNNIEIIGNLRDYSLRKESHRSSTPLLVNIVAYCLNQNHFHFILEPVAEEGIQKFMHRLSTGYTNYFNKKNKRTGALFQGRYKAKHISSNEYLLYLAVYVNLNNKVHKEKNELWMSEFPFSSAKEYFDDVKYVFCEKSIILDQFKDKKSFVNHCKNLLPVIQQRKEEEKEFAQMCID